MKKIIFGLLALTMVATAAPCLALPIVPQEGNLLLNGNFEKGELKWAPNKPGNDNLTIVGDPLIEGSSTAQVISESENQGIYSYSFQGAGTYTLSGWVFVEEGEARIALYSNVSRIYAPDIASTDSWQYVTLTTSFLYNDRVGALLYSGAPESSFYADGFWLNLGAESTSPFAPSAGYNPNPMVENLAVRSVPEPSTILLLGAGLLGLCVTARRKVPRRP